MPRHFKHTDKERGHALCHVQGSFKLEGLPVARPGEVLGLIGRNGIGKSTTLKLLAGILQPNFGHLDKPTHLQEILSLFPNKELRHYLNQILLGKLKVVMKPQHFKDMEGSTTAPNLRSLLGKYDSKMEEICHELELKELLDKPFRKLTHGQLQRVMIAAVASEEADVYIFDEPSCFLDVRERFIAARVIRNLLTRDNYVIVSDNDLSLLDYLSETIYCLHGKPGACGLLSRSYNARDGLHMFLTGFDSITSLRIRDDSLIFQFPHSPPRVTGSRFGFRKLSYGPMTRTVLGQNGTGKSTFIRMLISLGLPDQASVGRSMERTVRRLPNLEFHWSEGNLFASQVMKPLQIDQLMDRKVSSLSPGELQRVTIAVCLGRHAVVYLIDEPSAHLDADERVNVAIAIKRRMLSMTATAIVVEHDFMMATYLADQVILAERRVGSNFCFINSPCSLSEGMNKFLSQQLDIITCRQDPNDFILTPRINKLRSLSESEQKLSGQYYEERERPRFYFPAEIRLRF
ncbi:unnamed protein product [Arabis nemorensis]|uniref:ABC transporter domain-containing protein n=1 Tax=Arabis nemorensis TaxID=586526 RepID=A0A565BGP7_9BRAS|nr:unnamed protein product [Arabis nemorensis]